MLKQLKPGIYKHIKCRNAKYNNNIDRFNVPDNMLCWSIEFPEYKPTFYESPSILGKPWADPSIDKLTSVKWNESDGLINRKSYSVSKYLIEENLPLNPFGRTGLCGRGLLGRWGPNHAADPIVTRWKRDVNFQKILHTDTNLPILQMVAIERRDNREWAIPGGMVDAGEKVSETVKREFMEEALSTTDSSSEAINRFFQEDGVEVYAGYVDDPRNTDNAWMETVAFNFHDDNGNKVGQFELSAGDDAGKVKWMDLSHTINLYASHKLIIENVIERLKAHW